MNLNQCEGYHGDFTIARNGSRAYLIVTWAGRLCQERLTASWLDGAGRGTRTIRGLARVESPGVYRSGRRWVMTMSDPNCGYCTGTGTGYATAPLLRAPWTYHGRITTRSCGGQPRTVTVLDGVPYQGVDQWLGLRNETAARVLYVPLTALPKFPCPGPAAD